MNIGYIENKIDRLDKELDKAIKLKEKADKKYGTMPNPPGSYFKSHISIIKAEHRIYMISNMVLFYDYVEQEEFKEEFSKIELEISTAKNLLNELLNSDDRS
jgi:hypothetical protein